MSRTETKKAPLLQAKPRRKYTGSPKKEYGEKLNL
ncbi:hypothetical protein B14911_15122 [Bacillus sp. NRRL B-14911]|nr:hypothetical protein B14911_15122 [Bacillus sp. NRRL B-14911]